MSYGIRLPPLLDAAWRLGPRPVLLATWHRGPGRILGRRALAEAAPPAGPFLPAAAPSAPDLPPGHCAAVLARAAAIAPSDWHGPFRAAPHRWILTSSAPATSGRSGSGTAGRNYRCWPRRR